MMRFCLKKYYDTTIAVFSLMSLLFSFVSATEAQTVVNNGETSIIFIGQKATISDESKLSGNIQFVYQGKSENIKIPKRINLRNTESQQNIAAKRIKNTHTHTVYDPFSPFGNSVFLSKYLSSNATLQEETSHNCKLFAQNTFKYLSPEIIFTSKYFKTNTYFVLPSDNYACATGNLPPPEIC